MSGEGLTTDFPLVEQGYDPNKVDGYLATQMLQLREDADGAHRRIAELEEELSLAKEAQDALQMTMVLAKRASDELLTNARADADEILSEARREAFVLMTETRSDTEDSMSEGKAIIEAAREEALSVVAGVEAETTRLIAERDAALNKLRDEYEAESSMLIDRINTLRSIADDLEARNAGSPPETFSPEEERTADAPRAGTEPNHDDDGDAPVADKIRESFSGRRSAKLPRIGEEAGRSALAAATAMRAHLTNEPVDSEDGDDDLAARTA